MNENVKLNDCKDKFFINKKRQLKIAVYIWSKLSSIRSNKIYDISYYIKFYCNCQDFFLKK